MYINFNVHYTATARTEKDRSQLALWFAHRPPDHVLYRVPASGRTLIANGRQLLTDDPGTKAEGTDVAIPPIPPYARRYELIGITAYVEPVVLFEFQPHAHLRAHDFTYAVVYPDGRWQTLLTVPAYDFHWQLAYQLAAPLHVPAGSKLVVTAHYDNSAANAHLRDAAATDPTRNCGPDKVVHFRDENQSWDEMFSPIVQYSADDRAGTADDQAGTAGGGSRAHLAIRAAVGCLVPDPSGGWRLSRAALVAAPAAEATSRAEVDAARGRPLGAASYRLLAPEVFRPQDYAGDKVMAKGILLGAPNDARLNTTSLQRLGPRCD